MQKVRPLKRFGQNYLTDQNILNKISEEISPLPGENILEIGPGTGALTEKILERVSTLTSVEIDKRVADDLAARFPGLNLIRGDFMKMPLPELADESSKLRIIGNIPYNLTSPILFKLIENNSIVRDAVLMVQLEVAQRMTARKGSKDYGILAVLTQYFTKPKLCFKVSPNVFYPKPKVYSAVIHLNFNDDTLKGDDKQTFIKIVKASFGNRRKTLKNSLSNSIFRDINFDGSEINLALRAEQLEIGDFIKLSLFARDKIRTTGQTLNNTL